MNFRDLQYSFGKFKTNVEGQIARNISYKYRNTKQLSLWIFRERDDLSSLRTLAYQHSETNKALLQWINEEAQNNSDNEEDNEEGEKGGEQDNYDLKDLVGNKIVELLNKQVEIEQDYADQLQLYRQVIKSIRIREELVNDIREHGKALQYRLSQIESKRSKKYSDKITDLQALVASTEQEKQKAESELAGFKRVALREAFYLRFNALAEYAEKASIIAGFGKYLADLLTFDSPGNDYNKYNEQVANTIFSDAMQALNQWVPTQSDERPTLTGNLPKDTKENDNDYDNNNGKNRNKKNKSKKGKNEKEKDELEKEEEPLTQPELPPRQNRVGSLDPSVLEKHNSPFSSSNIPGLLYHNRGFSSSSTSSSGSRENTSSSELYQEAPPPSYTACLSTTSLNKISIGDTTPKTSQVRLEEEHTDHQYQYNDSGPSSISSPCSFFSYQPIEQINRQIQNKNNGNNKRSYMEFSQQYTHRRQPILQLSQTMEPTLLPPPLPRSRSIATLPLSLTAPSAPTEDELIFLPIPSAPPPSEF